LNLSKFINSPGYSLSRTFQGLENSEKNPGLSRTFQDAWEPCFADAIFTFAAKILLHSIAKKSIHAYTYLCIAQKEDVYAGISTNPLIKLFTYKLPASCPALSDKP